MHHAISMLALASCLGACGAEVTQLPEPEVPTTRTVQAPPALATTRFVAQSSGPVLLRAGQQGDMCLDASANRHGQVQLWKCHGRTNQRWTLAAHPSGAVQLVASTGTCVGGAPGASQLELSACGDQGARYRFEGGRLTDVASGQCVTATDLQNRGRIFLEACNAEGSGQVWTAAQVTATASEDEGASARVREETVWNKARVTGCALPVSLTGCDAVRIYLAKYPSGAHVDEANRALAAGQPQLESLQKDDNAWHKAGATQCRAHATKDACDGVDLYLVKYPAGIHAEEARQLGVKP